MSVRFENSHQCVGLNRVGKYFKTVPEKGPKNSTGLRAPSTNEPWRRWTGMVGADENRLSWKERKRGIRRLLKRIELSIANQRPPLVPPYKGGKYGAREWSPDLEDWARTKVAGRSLESICVEFGISKWRLNALTREYNSMSASEIIDGYKIRGLRKILGAQLREAAFSLWGAPGEFALRRCMNPVGDAANVCHGQPAVGCPCKRGGGVGKASDRTALGTTRLNQPAPGAPSHGQPKAGCPWHMMPRAQLSKRSRYFRTRPSEFFGVAPGDEERLRVSELLGKLDVIREECDWRVDNLAMQLGFECVGAFKKACMNVMGRTVEQLERILSREVVEYYLAAEDRELRELARRKIVGAKSPDYCRIPEEFVLRAREIYCGDAEVKPVPPFLDRWSAAKFAKPEWIKAMRKEFG